MADWGLLQRGLESGNTIGRQTGGKLSGLGMVLGKIADKLKQENAAKQAMGAHQNLLGMEEASKLRMAQAEGDIKSKLQKEEALLSPKAIPEWTPKTGNEAIMFERAKASLKPKTEAIVSDTGEIIGTRPVGAVFQPRPDPTEAIIAALGGGNVPSIKSQPPKIKYKNPGKFNPDKEQLIQDNMKAYGKSRQEVISALSKRNLL